MAERRLIELRIHGVSGTPAENMLDTPAVVQVAGDDLAGFWRPLVPESHPPYAWGKERVLEGYRWGGLTSRSAVRALWVLLAPFALMNAAGAMHIRAGEPVTEYRGIARGLEGALVRLFAVLLTLMLVLATFVAAVDIVGWQGGPITRKDGTMDPGVLRATWLETPAHRVAVLALVPVALLGVLWWLGRSTFKRYEKSDAAVAARTIAEPRPNEKRRKARSPLQDPEFWSGAETVESHQWLHLAAGLSFIALLIGVVLNEAGGEADDVVWLPATLLVASIAITAISNRSRSAAIGLLVAAGITLAALLIHTYSSAEFTAQEGTSLHGSNPSVLAMFVVQFGLLIPLALCGYVGYRRHRSTDHIRCKGMGSAFVTLGASLIGAAFSAGMILQVAKLVGEPRLESDVAGINQPVVTPDVMTWAARWIPAAVLLIALVAACAFGHVLKKRRTHLKLEVNPYSRRKNLANTIAWARLTDEVDVIIGWLAGISVVTATLAAFSTWRGDDQDPPSWLLWSGWPYVESIGTFLAIGFAGALLFLITRSYSQEGLRRKVGILWDLATFWPRQAHPLGPPCYAERTVPEIALRATYFRDGDNESPEPGFRPSNVVLSAHSQGSVIAAAALLQMADPSSIALLSYGSPLRRLYRAYFPTYFGGATLEELSMSIDCRWRHLSRDSDPIGGPAFHDPGAPQPPNDTVDVVVPTPPKHRPGDTADPIEGHSNYPREFVYKQQLEVLAEMLRTSETLKRAR